MVSIKFQNLILTENISDLRRNPTENWGRATVFGPVHGLHWR